MQPLLSACLGLLLALCLCFHNVSGSQIIGYKLQSNMTGSSFFDYFDFFTDDDPTHGYVNYVDREQARSEGLIRELPNSAVYIGTDVDNIASGRGRNSVRLQSKKSHNGGLFIVDLSHMPSGCGTWPALYAHPSPVHRFKPPLPMVLYNSSTASTGGCAGLIGPTMERLTLLKESMCK